jgi:hypothetical protein
MADRPIASFHFDPWKTWPFMLMLLAMMALGAARVWTHGLAEEWGIALLLIGLPALAFVMVGQELRLPAPVLVISEAGLLDHRRGPEPLPWSAIQEATIKRRAFHKGIRIVLTNGERHDIELNLLAAEPADIMRLIQEQAGRHATDAAA